MTECTGHPRRAARRVPTPLRRTLVERTSTEDGDHLPFSARPGVREWVLDLVPREAACCPFLSYEVDHEDDEIVWITRG